MKVAVFPSKKKKKNMKGTTPKSTVLHKQSMLRQNVRNSIAFMIHAFNI